MRNEDYQKATQEFALYPKKDAIDYLVLGLASEAGEVAGKLSKLLRGDFTEDQHQQWAEEMDKEMSDCLWFISQYCNETETSIGALMELNINKLRDRKNRGVIKGSGDNR